MKYTTLLLALTFSLSTAYAAPLKLSMDPIDTDEEEYKCDFEGVSSVKTSLYPDKAGSSQFNYRYQVVGNLDPNKLVVIYLPGGPGGSSMDDFKNQENFDYMVQTALPKDKAWIMIDPRTVGCNRGDEKKFPDDSLRSEYLASDVISVIKSLGLKKYILFGHSYGSQFATYIAAQAENEGAPTPHAIFISGILGRGEANGSFAIPYNLTLEWNLLRSTLNEKALEILNSEAPLGFEANIWDRFISSGLYRGTQEVEGKLRNKLHEKILLLNSENPEELKPLTDSLQSYVRGDGHGDYSSRLFNKVDCHEFSPADGYTTFSYGMIIRHPEDTTCDGEAFDRPYDSAKLLTTAPIYYIAGENDPAAPYKGAYYHFENQIQARRNFIKVPGGGHNKIGLIFSDCKDKIWDAIINQNDLDSVLPECKLGQDVELMIR